MTLSKNDTYLWNNVQCILQCMYIKGECYNVTYFFRNWITHDTLQVQNNADLYRTLWITKSISHKTYVFSIYTETLFSNNNFYWSKKEMKIWMSLTRSCAFTVYATQLTCTPKAHVTPAYHWTIKPKLKCGQQPYNTGI
jgi:hypothetical protein